MKHISFRHIPKVLASLAAALVLASCGGIADTDTPASQSGTANIRIAVADMARTAFPVLTEQSFVSYRLTVDGENAGYWQRNSDRNLTAYEVMNMGTVTVPTGEHTFVLTGSEANGASYSGSLTRTITTDTLLTFTLELSGVSSTGGGNVVIEVTYPTGDVKKLVITHYLSADETSYRSARSGTPVIVTGDSLTGSYTYRSSDDAVGEYIIEFAFYGGDDIPLATWLEYAYISASLTSYSSFEVTSFDDIYSIRYDEDSLEGAAALTSKPLFYTWQSQITLPTPTKTGYTFTGWYEEIDEDGAGVGSPVTGWAGTARTGNVTLYATWEINHYTVSFVTCVEGISVESQSVDYNTTVAVPTAPERTGFAFAGWYADSAFTTPFAFASTQITAATTLYARWSYTVAFNANAEDATGTMRSVVRYSDDTEPLTVAALGYTYTGNTFLGWALSQDAVTGAYGDGGVVPLSVFAAGNVTLYAIWHSDTDTSSFIVTFESNGGTGIAMQLVAAGEAATEPATPVRTGFTFLGWHTSADDGETLSESAYSFESEVTASLTLYAKWVHVGWYVSAAGSNAAYTDAATAYGDGTPAHPYASVAQAVSMIEAQNLESYDYTIYVSGVLTERVSITSANFTKAASLRICGTTGNSTDKLNGNASGTVLTLSSAVPVTLADIAITNGRTGSSYAGAGITVSGTGASLTLASGALVTGNTYQNSYTGSAGVFVNVGNLTVTEGAEISLNNASASGYGGGITLYSSTASATMSGGSISNNSAYYYGGGVYVSNGATFTMTGGSVSENTAVNCGGGVYVAGGTFTLGGGSISSNTVTTSSSSSYYYGGGGVYVSDSATFTMTGGEICDNRVPNATGTYMGGGGLMVVNSSSGTVTVTLSGGEIRGNSSRNQGGGIFMYKSSSTGVNCNVNLQGATICENEAGNGGGGVYVRGGSFTMSGGEISGNTAAVSSGGGVFLGSSYAYFTMSGGAISGNTASSGGGVYATTGVFTMTGGTVSSNSAVNGGGVYIESSFAMSGSAYIPCGADGSNDVYLNPSSWPGLRVTGELAAPADGGEWDSPVATLTLPDAKYVYGTQVFMTSGLSMTAEIASLFALTPVYGENWHLNVNGAYAELASDEYDITYKDLGGTDFTGTFASTAPAKHYYGRATSLLTPAREGYEFIGWFAAWHRDAESSALVADGAALTSLGAKAYHDDITLFAKWAPRTSTVEIGTRSLALTANTSAHTLTATSGFTGYQWLVDGVLVTETDSAWSVSEDGTTLTWNNENLLSEYVYVVKVRARDENGVKYEATKTVVRQ